ncbi:hypothetical protein ABZ804_22345 [Streptomyces sp. NPDC047726]|uniref:hypothetical protein n=1 Tax=unclassified Streptomyces TaxID=2593676 RepID=UPI0034014509
MLPPSARVPASVAGIDAALMRFPYGQWIRMPAAAAHVRDLGLPCESLTTVVRTGRRRGVLLTKRMLEQREAYVMRISETPYRTTAETA